MPTADILESLPARRGHFLLESGYHTDLWLTLDALFVDPRRVAPLVNALAERLRLHAMTAVCGPLVGGAFLAQALATALGIGFYYTEPRTGPALSRRLAAPPMPQKRARPRQGTDCGNRRLLPERLRRDDTVRPA